MQTEDAATYWDQTAAVNYMVWGDMAQWVSFDTNTTFQQKVDYANEVCLGGIMIWSLDQDTYDWQALGGLLGKDVASGDLLTGGSMSNTTATELATLYSAYTGSDCYITECKDWNTGQCKTGYSVLDYVHSGSLGMSEDPDTKLCKTGKEGDDDAQYRMICCPTNAIPEGCTLEGVNDSGFCSSGGSSCGSGKYELVSGSYADRMGETFCMGGKRSLCCNTDADLEKCSWRKCGHTCASDEYTFEKATTYAGTSMLFSAFSIESLKVTGEPVKAD
jgi:hypothetical protein